MLTLLLQTIRDWVLSTLAEFQRMYLGYITPQMFGAKGDGVTDDTEAFISAFNQGGVIFVPSGEYLVRSGNIINVDKDISVIGSDRNKAVINIYYPECTIYNRHPFQFVGSGDKNFSWSNIGLIYKKDTEGEHAETPTLLYIRGEYKNILIDNAYFHVGGSASTMPDITDVWAKVGADSFVFKNCLVENFTNNKLGGGLWVNSAEETTKDPTTGQYLGNIYHIESVEVADNEFRTTNSDEALCIFALAFDPSTSTSFSTIHVHDNTLKHLDYRGESNTTSNVLTVRSDYIHTLKASATINNNVLVLNRGTGDSVIKCIGLECADISHNQITIEDTASSDGQGAFDVRGGQVMIKNNIITYNPNVVMLYQHQGGEVILEGNTFYLKNVGLKFNIKNLETSNKLDIICNKFHLLNTADGNNVSFYYNNGASAARVRFNKNVCDTGVLVSELNGATIEIDDNILYDNKTVKKYFYIPFKAGVVKFRNNENVIVRFDLTRNHEVLLSNFIYEGMKSDLMFIDSNNQKVDYNENLFADYVTAHSCLYKDIVPTTDIDFTTLLGGDN